MPGENGFLVPKGDAETLAERMVWFIEHPEEWQRMGRRSREMAEERFDVHKINRELLKIMELQDGDRILE
jgi:glycosyltransferase involved in cell wall biosynthesis